MRSALRVGWELQEKVSDGRPLEKYPAFSPIVALQTILSNIQEQNQIKLPRGYSAFSSDHTQIATAEKDGHIRLWNLAGQLITEFKVTSSGIRSLKFSPNNSQIVILGEDGIVRLWTATGRFITQFDVSEDSENQDGEKRTPGDIAFTPDGKRIATFFGKIRLWTLEGQLVAELKIEPDEALLSGILVDFPLALMGNSMLLLMTATTYIYGVLLDRESLN
ncbi:MAG: hypothetical protein HC936_05705 [Leptolyngbyaceae cyanobacterium SU_3_3]|nr:hypothetical protein [Leptolyngbyaceae cyanobacterium SU_3_3]